MYGRPRLRDWRVPEGTVECAMSIGSRGVNRGCAWCEMVTDMPCAASCDRFMMYFDHPGPGDAQGSNHGRS